MGIELTLWQAILICLAAPVSIVFFVALREVLDVTVHWSPCVLMVLCIVFAVVFVR